MSALDEAVKRAWESWGWDAKWTACGGCGLFRYCRSRGRSKWLCIECFDQTV